MEDLEGCYVLRLADGSFAKVADITEDHRSFYVVDNDGFDLFKQIGARCLISPTALDMEIMNRLQLVSNFNVRRLDGPAIGQLLRTVIPRRNIKTFPESNSQWLTAVYQYVISKSLECDFYQYLPMLPLSNKPNVFVSMKFWNNKRLLPPIEDLNTRRIIDQFPDLFVLASLEFEPMRKLASATSAQRFMDYLYSLVKNDMTQLERKFHDKGIFTHSDIQVNLKVVVLIA